MLSTVPLEVELADLEATFAAGGSDTPLSTVIAAPRQPLRVERDNLDEVVERAVAGDRQATDQLLAYIRPLVIRYCRAKLGRNHRSFTSADDVSQEVCLAVFRALPGYRNMGRPFLSFVYGIAAHKIADVHRGSARDKSEPTAETPDSESLESEGPEQTLLRHELCERTGMLLAVLTQRQRDILIMRIVLGLSAQETAEAVGTTADAVRVAQHRALNRLRRIVGPARRAELVQRAS